MDTPEPKHDHAQLEFPQGFLWGAATSSYQVEGNNMYSDWWQWEVNHQPFDLRSGQACDQYNRYAEDFALAKDLNHNAHRLSLEWARIEPEEDQFNQNEIDHYKQVLKSLKDQGFTVMLTLHHFTNPAWFAKKGGWESFGAPKRFERFVKKVVPELKDYVDLWITINEPGVLMFQGYLIGVWPPQKKSFPTGIRVYWNLARAHKKAYKAIHQLVPNAKVGIANNVSSFDAFHHHSLREEIGVWALDIINNHLFYQMTGIQTHDFLGLNYYFNQYLSFNTHSRFPSFVDIATTKKDTSDLGWEVYPEGIFDVLMDFSDYHKPIYITENGLASTNDDRRVRFLISYLKEIYHAIQTGADVRGYFHWSLIDNFEWADGFVPRFGLVEVDFATQKRTPRPSSKVYAEIIKHNGIEHKLLKLLGHGIDVEAELKDIMKKDH
ncbi:MAG: glycoside hydrolase family 1 protein [Candidatus Daviesbacteria bacterium]|nr:MAG: glycoside hydrolase family 1 protein [Candidatus Daviesbacteria bacterium]